MKPKPFRWMLDVIWLNLVELSKLETFNQLLDRVSENEKVRTIEHTHKLAEFSNIPGVFGYQANDD